MNQREREVLKVMSLVLKGDRTQAEAARLLKRSVRQVRRLQRKLEAEGDGAVVHALRGKASNRCLDEAVKRQVIELYRERYGDFGPTLAAEKLAEAHELEVARETLRRWLVEEGLWKPARRHEQHRIRRERRACFGEMVQADASDHDWLEGRGPRLALVGMIDDATSRVVARFHVAETTEAYMDVLWRWIGKHGRPVSWYTDGHSIFRAESRLLGADEPVSVPTQFSRALEELGIELILAGSPQAKGRIERLWNTAQDRLVKELRLAGACTPEQANAVLEKVFLPWFNRRCVVKPSSVNDAHRPLDAKQDLAAVLSHQQTRTAGNDYTIRFENRVYQLLPPAWPGLRGGRVIVEQRLDGSMHIRFKGRYLEFKDLTGGKDGCLGAPPPNPRSLPNAPIPAEAEEKKAKGRAAGTARPSAVHRSAGSPGRTPALPGPSGGKSCGSGKDAYRPAPSHPWRTPFAGKRR